MEALLAELAYLKDQGYILDCWIDSVTAGKARRRYVRLNWTAEGRYPSGGLRKSRRYLKPEEVAYYTARIERGRRIQQIEAQLKGEMMGNPPMRSRKTFALSNLPPT